MTFAGSSLSVSSAAATDRTAEFLRLAAAAKAAQVREGSCDPSPLSPPRPLGQKTKRASSRASKRGKDNSNGHLFLNRCLSQLLSLTFYRSAPPFPSNPLHFTEPCERA